MTERLISDAEVKRLNEALQDCPGAKWKALSEQERSFLWANPDIRSELERAAHRKAQLKRAPNAPKMLGLAARPFYPEQGRSLEDVRAELFGKGDQAGLIERLFDSLPRLSEEFIADPFRWKADHPLRVAGVPIGLPAMLTAGRYAIKVDTGVGKTEAYLQALLRLTHYNPLLQVVISAPTHALCEDVKERLYRLARTNYPDLLSSSIPLAHVWYGLNSEVDGKRTCPKFKAVYAAQSAGRGRESLCRGKGGALCNYHPDAGGPSPCRMLLQSRETPRVWVVASAMLAHKRPDSLPQHHLLIIDESPFNYLVQNVASDLPEGDAHRPQNLSLPVFFKHREEPKSDDIEGIWRLNQALAALARVHADGNLFLPSGYVNAQALAVCGLDKSACRAFALIERCRRVGPDTPIIPNLNEGEIKEQNQLSIERNSHASAASRVWEAFGDVAVANGPTERLKLVGNELVARLPQPIHSDWLTDVETLYLDASFRPEIANAHLPYDEAWLVLADLRVRSENVVIRQVVRSGTNRTFLENLRDNERDKTTAKNALKDFMLRVGMLAAHFKDRGTGEYDGLIMGQKGFVDAVRKEFEGSQFGKRIALCHFNANRGVDHFKGVSWAICVGRPQPGRVDVSALAGVRFNYAPSASNENWEEDVRAIRTAGEAHPMVATAHHSDPYIDATLRAICDDEVMQTIGRTRPNSRTSDNPLYLEIINTLVLDIVVESVLEWGEYVEEVDLLDKLALKGIFPRAKDDLPAIGLFPSAEAARQDSSRKGWVLPQTKDAVPALPGARIIEASFALARSRKRRKVFVDENRVPDVRKSIAEMFQINEASIKIAA